MSFTSIQKSKKVVEAEIAPRCYFQHRVDDSPMVRARLIRWPVLSPDGKRGAYIKDYNLWVRDIASGKETQLTTDGVKDFVGSLISGNAQVETLTTSLTALYGSATEAGSNVTVARSDDRLTTTVCTPACFLRPRSTVATQLAQVIPVMGSVSCFVSDIIYL